jgi:phosphodiesterase/alkaline phosphatase D-like protein
MNTDKKTRRKFLKESAAFAITTMAFPAWKNEALTLSAFQAMGTRVGEVTDATAIIWTRLTAKKERNNKGIVIPGRAQDYDNNQLPEPKVPAEELEGACQGITGFVRIHYGTEESLKNAKRSDWVGVSEKTDFIHHFHLKNLQSNATYFYES